jgi:molybdenum cofactor cytidylyltransferase
VKFGPVPLDRAEGAILAHSERVGQATFRKGRVLAPEDLLAMKEAGFGEVTVVRLDPGDLTENEAAQRLANALAGPDIALSNTATGRCNLAAASAGIALFDAGYIDTVNLIDEAVTVSTVRPFEHVDKGDIVATVKIITFAVAGATVKKCVEAAGKGQNRVSVAPYRQTAVGLVQTRLPVLRASLLDKAAEVTRARLETMGCRLDHDIRCDHQTDAIANAFRSLSKSGCGIALALGASAIADRADVIPAAVEACGGTVEHFGMPVDPGNLMLLGRIGEMRILGLPGSARSPRLHGFDWVLRRLVAGIDVTGEDLMRMGVGGLLKEIPSRPLPRLSAVSSSTNETDMKQTRRIAAVILAAGQSRRMGKANKLMEVVNGKPMMLHAVDAAIAAGTKPVVVVTGHEPERIEKTVEGRSVTIVHNPDFANGLSTSLRAAVNALSDDIEGIVVCLGDMPAVTTAHIEKLMSAFDPASGRFIVVPTVRGKRGNPVLWHRRYFDQMTQISGDVGARHLIGENEDALVEIAMDDDAVLQDLDTPAALEAFRSTLTDG